MVVHPNIRKECFSACCAADVQMIYQKGEGNHGRARWDFVHDECTFCKKPCEVVSDRDALRFLIGRENVSTRYLLVKKARTTPSATL